MVRTKRRWLKFSLRGLLLIVAIFGVWLGIEMNAARRQAAAVAAILDAGGAVAFDYQLAHVSDGERGRFKIDWNKGPSTAPWLRALFGDDFFRTAVGVSIWRANNLRHLNNFLEQASKLRSLKRFTIAWVPEDDQFLGSVSFFLEQLQSSSDLDELHLSIDGVDPRGPDGERVSHDRWFEEQRPLRELRATLQSLHRKFPSADISGFYEANDVGGPFF